MVAITLATFNVAPQRSATRKYSDMGPAVVERLRRYAFRHGYKFLDTPRNPDAHPICWEKFDLILSALNTADWVIWVDSDAMPTNLNRPLAPILDRNADFVTQCPTTFLSPLGWDAEDCEAKMPFNTGVFAVRRNAPARAILRRAAAMRQNLPRDADWDGIGDQEAIISCLESADAKVAYVAGLQAHPGHVTDQTLFVHFYGNNAAQLFSDDTARNLIDQWHKALDAGDQLPPEAERYHWACIQNMSQGDPVCRGGPDRFMYCLEDLVGPNHAA